MYMYNTRNLQLRTLSLSLSSAIRKVAGGLSYATHFICHVQLLLFTPYTLKNATCTQDYK